ncbi:CopG family ribbon-helix-helix protein [Rhizobium panacihumi]|uniref:CopG family ribbon-helix-helix protein n=1 Tax=Rhizobium panacihumi TaxID=2008450 RepID=UPI003D7B2A7C
MAALTKLTIEISEDTKTGLDRLAGTSDASSSRLAGDAIAAYVEHELEMIHEIEAGLSDLKAGRVVPHDAAMAEITDLISAAQAKRA